MSFQISNNSGNIGSLDSAIQERLISAEKQISLKTDNYNYILGRRYSQFYKVYPWQGSEQDITFAVRLIFVE